MRDCLEHVCGQFPVIADDGAMARLGLKNLSMCEKMMRSPSKVLTVPLMAA